MKTTVMVKGAAQHDMVGRFLGFPLKVTAESISPGTAERIHRYAIQRLESAGFAKMVEGWEAEVYTLDGDTPSTDRGYTVKFKNTDGGYIEVIGILTHKGWPDIDHGFEIGQENL